MVNDCYNRGIILCADIMSESKDFVAERLAIKSHLNNFLTCTASDIEKNAVFMSILQANFAFSNLEDIRGIDFGDFRDIAVDLWRSIIFIKTYSEEQICSFPAGSITSAPKRFWMIGR
ncbi:unnamed protein product [Gordionus sp. m RMFG-2023]